MKMMPPYLDLAVTLAILAFFSLFSYHKKLLDAKGILVADALGLIVFYSGGLNAFATLLVFYGTAELATKFGRSEKKKHAQRTTANIIGNGGPAVVSLAMGSTIGFFGALSTALADTVSSEIGITSREKPVMITTLKQVEPGTDGGITLRGLLAGLAAGTLIGYLYYLLFTPSPKAFALIAIVGVMGSIVDSLLGATLQKQGVLDNNQVNFVASSIGALAIVALQSTA